ncbi:hypothetical protein, partial [Fodinicurvata fenggangensis]|uniref:hypothetical protein n=1 Tax=Fodinicurvata fenggangensis TaxID=1121830 RepID=UPI001B7FF93F
MKYTFKHTILAGVALGALAFSGYLLQEVTSGGKAGTAHAASDKAGQGHGGGQGGKAGAGKGAGGSQQGKGGRSLLDDVLSPGHDKDQEDHDDEGHETEDDSDRPDWAGQSGRDGKPGNPNQTPGSSKGGLYGDLFAILRDDNGVPILYVWEDQDGDGVPDTAVQSDDGYPQPVDAEGNLIPLSEEGEPVSDENVTEIEFSRLNVARSPTRVLSSRYLEAITSINQADELSLDSAGRLVITVDGESRTIDSPLENLAIYVELMNTGTLDGVTLDAETLGDLA